jgi:hypothetical protein
MMQSADQLPILPVISPAARPGTAPSGRRRSAPRAHGGVASPARSLSKQAMEQDGGGNSDGGDDYSDYTYGDDDYSEFGDDQQSNASDISGMFEVPRFPRNNNGWHLNSHNHHLSRPHTAGTTASSSSTYSNLGIVSSAESDGELFEAGMLSASMSQAAANNNNNSDRRFRASPSRHSSPIRHPRAKKSGSSPAMVSSSSSSPASPSLLSPKLFTQRFHQLVHETRVRARTSIEKASAIQSIGIELELQGRTTRLENQIDQALENTLKAYSKLRKTYQRQRDEFIPLDFLLHGLDNQRGHPYVKEIAASRVLKWMARALLRPKMRSRFKSWVVYMRWFQYLHRCRRAVKKVGKWYRRFALKQWALYTSWHREQERERASLHLQRLVRGHGGRLRAYKRLLFVNAWVIQYFWHRSLANLVVRERRARREGARGMQRMMRGYIARRVSATKVQAWSRANDARNKFRNMKWCVRWLQNRLQANWTQEEYLRLRACVLRVQTRWRQRDAWRQVHFVWCARQVQRVMRGFRARVRCWHKRRMHAVPAIQCWWRCFRAKSFVARRWWAHEHIQKNMLMWSALKRYKLMMAGRNRAKKKARIRVSVRPIHGEFHVVAAVRPGRLEWKWKKINGRKMAVPTYIQGKGLELQIFRVTDGKDYRGFVSHEELLRRHRMYSRRGKQFEGGVYTKEFVNLLFDQVQIHKFGGTAGIVQTTRTERGRLVSSFGVKRPRSIRASARENVPDVGTEDPEDTKLRTYVVQVFKHLDSYAFRAFDPDICRTYRCQVPERQLLMRLNKPDCPLGDQHKVLNVMVPEGATPSSTPRRRAEDAEVGRMGQPSTTASRTTASATATPTTSANQGQDQETEKVAAEKKAVKPLVPKMAVLATSPDDDGKEPLLGLSRTALSWLTTRMVIQDRYLMQAYWKSPLFNEGVMVLDQAEDVMACKIQSCWRHRLARAQLYARVTAKYRKYWSSEHQQYYYVNLMDEDETQLWEKPWIIDLCYRAYLRCDKLSFDRLQEIPRNPYKRKQYVQEDKSLYVRVQRYREYLWNTWGEYEPTYFVLRADIEVLDQWDQMTTPDGGVMYWNGSRDVYSPYSEAQASDLIANFYRRNIVSELQLPSLAHLAKSILFHRRVQADYERRPDSLAAVLNFALLNHTVRNDMVKAKTLYEEAYRMSESNPTVMYCYGLFILANRDFKFRGPQGNKGLKMIADALALDDRQEKFKTAGDTFFRAAVLLNNTSAPALRNFALVAQIIQSDFKAADRFYARSLKLDSYDESTQVNYLDFLEGCAHASKDEKGRPVKAGKFRLAGPPMQVKTASALLAPADSQGWERWSNPRPKVRSHRTFWYRADTARGHWLSPYWKPRGFSKEEETIMKAKRRVVLASERYRKKPSQRDFGSPSDALGSWGGAGGGDATAQGGAGGGGGGGGRDGGDGGGDTGDDAAAKITGELSAAEQAEMIAARVQNDMITVKTLLDGTHSKLAELELQTIKHSRELIKRLNNTDDRTMMYDHEKQEYEIQNLTRQTEEQQARVEELERTLRLQSEEMKERQKFFREQGQRMEQVTAGLGDLESVLTAKQQKALMKRRKDVLARQEEEGGEVGEAPRAEDDGAVTPPIEPEVVPDNSPGIEV